MPGRSGSDIQRSELNREAGAYLERARKSLEPQPSMDEFLDRLSQEMRVRVPYTRYNGWESARSPVPAAAMIAMFRLTGLPVADPAGEQTLAAQLQLIKVEQRSLRVELEGIREALKSRLLVDLGAPGLPQP